MFSVTASNEEACRRELAWLKAFPLASALLAVWARPWSSNAQRYALHALTRAWHAGLDVLEPGVDRTRYTSAEALIAAWDRPELPSAHTQARRVLAGIASMVGGEVERLA